MLPNEKQDFLYHKKKNISEIAKQAHDNLNLNTIESNKIKYFKF